MFRRAMKRAVTNTMRVGAEGIKVKVGGRLNGAEIARSEWYREGRVPLHTLRADIDYGLAEARTTYGIIGVKVWVFKGEVFDAREEKAAAQSEQEAQPARVGAAAQPGMIYDYSGFPPESYEVQYPAPGQPELAGQAQRCLSDHGLEGKLHADRGFDHGVFVPLKLLFPEAQVPVVPISLHAGLDPALHIALGRAIKPLRAQNVMIVGSGMTFHNLPMLFDDRKLFGISVGGTGRGEDDHLQIARAHRLQEIEAAGHIVREVKPRCLHGFAYVG